MWCVDVMFLYFIAHTDEILKTLACKKDPFAGPVCNNVIGNQCQFLLSEIVELTSSWVSVPVLILIVG